jgi:glycosyltransferase involved in cell wall biosynthesis
MSDSPPPVSIVLPTHNRSAELPRAIESVLAQSWTDFELIVVDDGSTDDTERVVRAFDDPRLRYTRHETNRGGSAARNTGVRMARAPLIAFQDSDDEWLPEKLDKQLRLLRECPPRVGVVGCAYARTADDGSSARFPPPGVGGPETDLGPALLRESLLGTPTLVVRRECLDRAGPFDERLARFQDWELLIHISQSYEIRALDEVLVVARFGGGNITAGHDRALAEAERLILDKHRDAFRRAGPRLLAYRHWHLAHILFMRGEMAEGRRELRRALHLDRRPRYLLFLGLSASGWLYRSAYRLARAR